VNGVVYTCRLNRLLKSWRVGEFLRLANMRSSRPFVVRVTTLLIIVVVVIHWNACFYLVLSDYAGHGADGWVYGQLA